MAFGSRSSSSSGRSSSLGSRAGTLSGISARQSGVSGAPSTTITTAPPDQTGVFKSSIDAPAGTLSRTSAQTGTVYGSVAERKAEEAFSAGAPSVTTGVIRTDVLQARDIARGTFTAQQAQANQARARQQQAFERQQAGALSIEEEKKKISARFPTLSQRQKIEQELTIGTASVGIAGGLTSTIIDEDKTLTAQAKEFSRQEAISQRIQKSPAFASFALGTGLAYTPYAESFIAETEKQAKEKQATEKERQTRIEQIKLLTQPFSNIGTQTGLFALGKRTAELISPPSEEQKKALQELSEFKDIRVTPLLPALEKGSEFGKSLQLSAEQRRERIIKEQGKQNIFQAGLGVGETVAGRLIQSASERPATTALVTGGLILAPEILTGIGGTTTGAISSIAKIPLLVPTAFTIAGTGLRYATGDVTSITGRPFSFKEIVAQEALPIIALETARVGYKGVKTFAEKPRFVDTILGTSKEQVSIIDLPTTSAIKTTGGAIATVRVRSVADILGGKEGKFVVGTVETTGKPSIYTKGLTPDYSRVIGVETKKVSYPTLTGDQFLKGFEQKGKVTLQQVIPKEIPDYTKLTLRADKRISIPETRFKLTLEGKPQSYDIKSILYDQPSVEGTKGFQRRIQVKGKDVLKQFLEIGQIKETGEFTSLLGESAKGEKIRTGERITPEEFLQAKIVKGEIKTGLGKQTVTGKITGLEPTFDIGTRKIPITTAGFKEVPIQLIIPKTKEITYNPLGITQIPKFQAGIKVRTTKIETFPYLKEFTPQTILELRSGSILEGGINFEDVLTKPPKRLIGKAKVGVDYDTILKQEGIQKIPFPKPIKQIKVTEIKKPSTVFKTGISDINTGGTGQVTNVFGEQQRTELIKQIQKYSLPYEDIVSSFAKDFVQESISKGTLFPPLIQPVQREKVTPQQKVFPKVFTGEKLRVKQEFEPFKETKKEQPKIKPLQFPVIDIGFKQRQQGGIIQVPKQETKIKPKQDIIEITDFTGGQPETKKTPPTVIKTPPPFVPTPFFPEPKRPTGLFPFFKLREPTGEQAKGKGEAKKGYLPSLLAVEFGIKSGFTKDVTGAGIRPLIIPSKKKEQKKQKKLFESFFGKSKSVKLITKSKRF